jgi:YidC/Oxa1 family membrane protein insertase
MVLELHPLEALVKTDQERRVILAIALSVLVLMSWQWLFPSPVPVTPVAEETQPVDAAMQPAGSATVAASAPAVPAVVPAPVVQTIEAHSESVELELVEATVSSENGALRAVTLSEYEAMVQVMPIWTWVIDSFSGEASESWIPYSGGDAPRQVLTEDGGLVLAGAGAFDDDGAGSPGGPSAYQVTRDGDAVVATRQRADGLVIQKRYVPGEKPYTFDVSVTVTNNGGSTIGPVWVGVAQRMEGSGGSMFDRSANVTAPQAYIDGVETVMSADDLAGAEQERFTGPVSWLGVGDRYFAAVLLPSGGTELEGPQGVVVMDALPGGRVGSFFVDEAALDAGASRTLSFTAYAGPKQLDLLRAVGPHLDEAVEYGWFGFFSKILLLFLEFFHTAVGNWGVAIILLTLTIKLVFFRLNEKALASSEKMKKLQPEVEALKEQYKDDQQLQSQEMMKLWQKHGVSPLGGCLPMLVQMPVFFALYTVMYYSVELYDAQFLYLQDLTATDPYGVIPTLYAALMVAQQSMMPTANMDPTQAKMMKMMPLFFAFIMFSFPSGLVLYFCINMLLTIGQQYIIRRRLREEPAEPAAA